MPLKRKHDPGYKLPEIIDPDTCCICIPLPNDFNHKMAFLGQLDELGYWWNWERDPDKKGTQAAAVWRTIVSCIREDLNMSDCGCGDDKPTNTRINPETGLYEVSYDGGDTWQPDPASDPRSSGVLFPPLPGDPSSALRCQAANSAVGFFEDLQDKEHDQLVANSTIADMILATIAALSALGFIFAFVPAAVTALLAFVVGTFGHMIAEDFDESFTGSTWDTLLCVLYCNMSADGSFTEAAWQSVKNEARAMVGGYAGQWLFDHINLIGVVGLTNAGRASFPGTRSCDGCECSNQCIHETNIIVGTFVSETESTITIDAVLTTYGGDEAYWVVYGSNTAAFCCTLCNQVWTPDIDGGVWYDCEGVLHSSGSPINNTVRRIEYKREAATFQVTLTFSEGECV